MRYGSNLRSIKRITIAASVIALVVFVILFITAYVHGTLWEVRFLKYLFGGPVFIFLIMHFAVWLTTILSIDIDDGKIALVVFYKYRLKQRPIDEIESVNTESSGLTIRFQDGSVIRTVGIYIPECNRLVEDIRKLRKEPLTVKSDWLPIE